MHQTETVKKFVLLSLFLLSQLSFSQELDIQGHRGARGLLPENTIPAFIRAIDEGVTTLELDVVITKDKKVVLSHEPYMSSTICRTPEGNDVSKDEAKNHNIFQMTYDQVRTFDCGSRGNPRFPEQEKMKLFKPLLTDLIDEVEAYLNEKGLNKVKYNIELKSSEKGDNIYHPGVKEFSDLVASLLKVKLPKERYTIQCFDFRILQYWNKEYPEITLVALVENANGLDRNLDRLGFTPDVYSPYHMLLSKKTIDKAHEKGMKVVPWTVNNFDQMKKLVDMGVDGIITDYPNIAKELTK